MDVQLQPMVANNKPNFSKIDLNWSDFSIYIIQPALVNQPGIEEITPIPTVEGVDKLELLY